MPEDRAPTAPSSADRSRRVYFWWAVGLGFLAALGLFCWLVLGPVLRVRAAAREARAGRLTAERAVERLGGPRKALPMIALYLRLPKRLAAERGMAVYLLRGCGREAVPLLVKVLVKELASEDEPVGACWALGCMGPEARGAGPALVKVLESKPSSFWSRFFAVWALGETGAADGSAVPVLVEALKDEYDLVQSAAAQVLGRMGPAAKAAEPELQKLLEALNAKEESSHTIIGPTTFRHASGDSTIVIPKTKDAVIEALKSVRGEGAADAGK